MKVRPPRNRASHGLPDRLGLVMKEFLNGASITSSDGMGEAMGAPVCVDAISIRVVTD